MTQNTELRTLDQCFNIIQNAHKKGEGAEFMFAIFQRINWKKSKEDTRSTVQDFVTYYYKNQKGFITKDPVAFFRSKIEGWLKRSLDFSGIGEASDKEDAQAITDALKILDEAQKITNVSDCPYHLLPPEIIQIVEDAYKYRHFNKDYSVMTILNVAAAAVGNLMLYESILGYEDHCLMYTVLVGERGVGKSHIPKFFLKPLQVRDIKSYGIYQQMLSQGNEIEKIPIEKFILKDFTIEALKKICTNNERGCIIYVDELKKFFADGERYSGAGFEDDLLQIFSRDTLDNNRSKTGWVMMNSIFTNIIGTTQPSNLKSFFANGKLESGLTDRFLFIYPEKEKKRDLVDMIVPNWDKEKWSEIVNKIIEIDDFGNTDIGKKNLYNVVQFSKTARKNYVEYVNKKIRQESSLVDSNIEYAYAKLETYIGRLALTIHALRYACGEKVDIRIIDEKSMYIACQFCEYIKSHIEKTHEFELNRNPITKLDDWQKILFSQIESFCRSKNERIIKTNELLIIGAELKTKTGKKGFSERNLMNFLKNKNLFKPMEKGRYEVIA